MRRVSVTNVPKKRDGAVGEGACRPRKPIRLRHQRNKRLREPHSSFTSAYRVKDYNAAPHGDCSKLDSSEEISARSVAVRARNPQLGLWLTSAFKIRIFPAKVTPCQLPTSSPSHPLLEYQRL